MTTIGACGFTLTSPVRMPTLSSPYARWKSPNFWLLSALSGVV